MPSIGQLNCFMANVFKRRRTAAGPYAPRLGLHGNGCMLNHTPVAAGCVDSRFHGNDGWGVWVGVAGVGGRRFPPPGAHKGSPLRMGRAPTRDAPTVHGTRDAPTVPSPAGKGPWVARVSGVVAGVGGRRFPPAGPAGPARRPQGTPLRFHPLRGRAPGSRVLVASSRVLVGGDSPPPAPPGAHKGRPYGSISCGEGPLGRAC